MALASLESMQNGEMGTDCSITTSVMGTCRPFLQLKICQGSGIPGRMDKMVEKGALELVDNPGLGYYSSLFGPEGAWRLATPDQSFEPERVCYTYQV